MVKKAKGDGSKFSLTNMAIVLVLAAWAVNFAARFLIVDYEPNVQLDTMLMAVLGFLLAGKYTKQEGSGIPTQPTTPAVKQADTEEVES